MRFLYHVGSFCAFRRVSYVCEIIAGAWGNPRCACVVAIWPEFAVVEYADGTTTLVLFPEFAGERMCEASA
ncbi:MAG: hypothetical protein KGL39_05675 [Patescibacteria group bacterium]|nr:hypothetical protein [Patescibacteria group bacterium]